MLTSSNPSDQSLESILQLLGQQAAKGADISPYLSAIQSLNGTKPGEKYRELNLIVKKLVASNNQADATSTEVPAAMAPLVQLLVAKELKSFEIVRDALKSEDKTILNHALDTKWFFDASNSYVDVDYFETNIMPHVSERTRFRIIKNLSKSLLSAPAKAENFFTKFTELYGIKEAMPLLLACSDDFIFNEILKRKIYITPRKLLTWYKKHPKVVIRYLNLGNKKNESNKEEREIYTIDLYKYQEKFLPHLIRHNVSDFIELYNQFSFEKLGSTLSALLIKNATDEIIRNPEPYLRLVTLKAVCKKLTLEQIEEMYANLFPETDDKFRFGEMLQYLEYYPKVKRLDLMKRLYKQKYSRDLLSDIYNINSEDLDLVYNMISPQLFEELFTKTFPTNVRNFDVDRFLSYLHLFPRERAVTLLLEKFKSFYGEDLLSSIERIESELLLKGLPSDVRAVQAKRLVDLYLNDDIDEYYKWCCFLPPKESFAIFKEVIAKTSSDTRRCEYITNMLASCSVYESMEGLLNVLGYYNTRHKNERLEVLSIILLYISEHFDLKRFKKSHWQILREIMQRAHTKNDFLKLTVNQIGPFLGAAVYHLLIQSKCDNEMMPEDDKIFLDKIFDMTIDYNVESPYSKWIFIAPCVSVQRYCFDRLLKSTVIKYPKEHTIWQNKAGFNRKIKVLTDILAAFITCNEAIQKFNKKSQDITSHIKNVNIRDYPWVTELIQELNESDSLPISDRRGIKYHLKSIDLELSLSFKRSKQENISPISDVKSGAAWIKLKKDQDDVLAHWTEYLSACREKLKFNAKSGALAARRFLLSILWYKDLPIRFVERCLLEVQEVGSIKVLSILLDGESFSKLAGLFAPKNSSVDSLGEDSRAYYTMVQSILPAMNFTNPPVAFDVISLFCQGDYTKLAIQTFSHASQRVSRAKIMEFANDIIKKPVSVKKHGIKLIFQVANVNELRKFVENTWRLETHVSIRELMAQIIQKKIQDNPNEDNWNLMKLCIDGLTIKDEIPLIVLCSLSSLENKYLGDYLTQLLNKIEELTTNGLDETITSKLISTAFESITSDQIKFFSEDKIMEYLEKYFFDAKSSNVHSATRRFALKVFNRHYSEH